MADADLAEEEEEEEEEEDSGDDGLVGEILLICWGRMVDPFVWVLSIFEKRASGWDLEKRI
jgi:hypothetical protein